MKIYQIYYKQEQLPQLETTFTPWDNTGNPRPDLQEWYIWDQMYQRCCDEGLDYWGFMSWKFRSKTNLSGQQFVDWITANPGHDVYFVNPAILNEAVFQNGWEQGDVHHPHLSDIGNEFLAKIGYEDLDVKTLVSDCTNLMWANYWVGSRKFWDRYMTFTRKLFSEMDLDPKFKDAVLAPGASTYNLNKALPMFPFIIERLITTYIDLEGIDALGYQYTRDTVDPKYYPYWDDIHAISELKSLINACDNEKIYPLWHHFRSSFLSRYPGIIHIE